ncbi:MAG: SufD family Fe-S cluster assembly protein [Pseudomonadota bacterium]
MPEDILSSEETSILTPVGFGATPDRAATSVLADQEIRISESNDPNVVVLPLQTALERYDWVQDLMLNLIRPDENDHVQQAAERVEDPLGHFLWVKDGAKVRLPVQSFTLLETPQARQFTHNITVIGEGAEVEMISGAAVPARVHAGHHVSIEETYIRAGAKCRSISIENWGEGMQVHSYSRTEVAEGAEQTSNQIMLGPVRHHLSDTKSTVGANARQNDQAIIFAPKGTERVFDTVTHLTAPGAQCESLARMVAAGGIILNRARLVGEASETVGFLGCDGLKLSDAGALEAVPSLTAIAEGSQLSHEASVGTVGAEKLAYLMASGLSEDAARDLIVQGFLNLKDQYLPDELRAQVAEMIGAAKSGGM